jgi:hypothetical protein
MESSAPVAVGGHSLREGLRADAGHYARAYCEENVARRLEALSPAARRLAFALVVSNARRSVAVAYQRAGADAPGGVCIWDYHVVHLELSADGTSWRVCDLDSTLPFPETAEAYLASSFPAVREHFRPCFRLVGADRFVATFASTRRHMRDSATGDWLAPPPQWPCMRGNEALEEDTLPRFLPPSGVGEAANDVDAGFGADAAGVDELRALLERVRAQRARKA